MEIIQFLTNTDTIETTYLVIISSILSILIISLIKKIMDKKGKLNQLDNTEKDYVMSRIGRYVAILVYAAAYFINELIITKTVTFDSTLVTIIIAGATLTLTTTKGIYTYFHQFVKNKNAYQILKSTEEVLDSATKELSNSSSAEDTKSTNEIMEYLLTSDSSSKESNKND